MVQKAPNYHDRKRLVFLALFLCALFSFLIAQFFRIQIIEGEHWSKEADKQHYFIIKEPFLRGKFISNTSIKKGHPEIPQHFVTDVLKFHLHIDPESIPESAKEAVGKKLIKLLDLTLEESFLLKSHLTKKSRNRRVALWLESNVRDSILDWWTPFAKKRNIPRNALFFVGDFQRSYPFGKLFGQGLHTVQNIKDETTLQAIPTGGLELYFDSYLKGKGGKRRLMRSPRNSLETGEVIIAPQNGADIYLTINHCLQAIAEDELAKGVKKSQAKSGWAVMMDPMTGEILALAQYPFFHPSDYQAYFNDPLLIQQTKVCAITDANEPGSVMKPITMAIALKANDTLKAMGKKPIFDPKEMMPTSDSRFPGRAKPLTDTTFHSFLNMNLAIQKSSNIYAARLVEKIIASLGNEWYRQVLYDDFGFGQKTGIELPSESRGVLPMIGKKHPNGALEWSVPTPFSLAIGHNIQTTTLQVLRAFSVFANGGRLVKPTLIRKIVKTRPDGSKEILVDNTETKRFDRFPQVVSPEAVKQVLEAIKFTTKPGGTARRADVWGYTEAGKTGTANKIVNGTYSVQHVCSTFIGIVPLSKPSYVIAVVMDEPEYGYLPGLGKKHHGGTCAAPVFREIAKRSLEYLGIAPDDPYGYPVGDPRYDAARADWIFETKQLQEIYEKWNNQSKKIK